MQCKNCGNQIPADALFCDFCGSKIIREEKKAFCGACGAELEAGSVFCGSCGAPVTGEKNDGKGDDEVRSSNKPLIVIIILLIIFLAVIAAGFFILLHGGNKDNNGDIDIGGNYNGLEVVTQKPTDDANTKSTEKPNSGNMVVATPTPTPSPTPSPAPSPAAKAQTEHTYKVVVEKVSWETAKNRAAGMGGYLVAISNAEEFQKITSLLSGSEYSNVKNVWIGACAPANIKNAADAAAYWNSPQAAWVNGEPFAFAKWRSGEPSGYDPSLNAPERYLQIFRPKADNYQWSYNDAGDDLSEYKDGSLAYVVEFER